MFIHLPSPSDDKLIKDRDWEATTVPAQHMLEAVDERPSLVQPLLVSQRDPDTGVLLLPPGPGTAPLFFLGIFLPAKYLISELHIYLDPKPPVWPWAPERKGQGPVVAPLRTGQRTMAGSVQGANNQPGTARVEVLPDRLDFFWAGTLRITLELSQWDGRFLHGGEAVTWQRQAWKTWLEKKQSLRERSL